MGNLSLVKSLSHLREEQKYTEEVLLEAWNIALVRGNLTEITGEPSSGKTSLPLTLLARLTQTGEICAVVDSANSFDPCSALLGGVELENLLWIRCGGDLEKAFMSADMLVQAKGFGIDIVTVSRKRRPSLWLLLLNRSSVLPRSGLLALPVTVPSGPVAAVTNCCGNST